MGACPSRSEAVRSLCPGRRPRAGRCRPGGVRSLPNERSGLWEPLEARALPGGGSRDQRLSICRDGLRGAAPRSLPPRPAEPPTSPERARTSISSEGRVLAAWPPSPGLGTPGTEQLPVICTLEDSLTPAERRMRNSANTEYLRTIRPDGTGLRAVAPIHASDARADRRRGRGGRARTRVASPPVPACICPATPLAPSVPRPGGRRSPYEPSRSRASASTTTAAGCLTLGPAGGLTVPSGRCDVRGDVLRVPPDPADQRRGQCMQEEQPDEIQALL